MLARLCWNDGAIATLGKDLMWTITPSDEPLRKAIQHKFEAAMGLLTSIGDDTERGIDAVAATFKPSKVQKFGM
jgi:hypothetical protein